MKETTTIKRLSVIAGLLGLAIGIVMLYFRPHESWYDDAYWADWGYRLSQGNYLTHVWGGGQPSYSPLYALLMAVWYRVVGFSYFTAQLPNLLIAFAAYLVVCLRIEGGKLFRTKWAAVCFAFGYWVSDGLFGVFTCGRVDTLCLLLGVLTVDAYFRAYKDNKTKDIVWFCIWSFLQMATGFEGVLFTVGVLLIHALLEFRDSLRKWWLYVWYALSSIVSFAAVIAFMAYHNCAKAFIRTMFGFSYTIQSIIHFFETGEFTLVNPVPLNDSMTFWERINNMTIEGFFANKEYLVLIIFVIALSVIVLCRKGKGSLSHIERTMIISSILLPWFYILAGRYSWYYTWAAYVPCLISFCVLIEHTHSEKVLAPLVCLGMVVWFCFSPDFQDRKRVDFRHEIDAQNLRDIEAAEIDPNESVYVPYKWYYYLAPTHDKLYFKGSGRYPKDMTKMVLSTTKEVDQWCNTLELEYLYNIDTLQVYRVVGDRGSHILK